MNATVKGGREMKAALDGDQRRTWRPSSENLQNQTQVLWLATFLEGSLPNTGPRFRFTGGQKTSANHPPDEGSAEHVPFHYEHMALRQANGSKTALPETGRTCLDAGIGGDPGITPHNAPGF